MEPPSAWDAQSFAQFLVQIFPEDAIRLLCNGRICNLEAIREEVVRACAKLGSHHQVWALVLDRNIGELEQLRTAPYRYGQASIGFRSPGALPPTPAISFASGSQRSQQAPNCDWIIGYHGGYSSQMAAKNSGCDAYMIGEDKLDRFQGLEPKFATPEAFGVGGQRIVLEKTVRLVWNRPGDSLTNFATFWVVPTNGIRHADVLLGRAGRASRGNDKGSLNPCSPLSLPSKTPPVAPAPMPPPAFWPRASTSAIYTDGGGSRSATADQSSNGLDLEASSHRQPRPPKTTASMGSGPLLAHNSVPSPSLSTTGFPPPSSESGRSTGTAKLSNSDFVLVNVLFQGGGTTKLTHLDLTMTDDRAIDHITAVVNKISKENGLDRYSQEMVVTPLLVRNSQPQSCSLGDEFGFYWGAMTEFIRENRSPEPSRKPEFLVDIT